MMEALISFFKADYMPHGHCYFWNSGILWTHVLSDAIIALSYFSIPLILLTILKKHKEWAFKKVFFLFAAFILFCGVTHLFAIFTIWHGAYGAHGILKASTAAVSLFTVIVLFRSLPAILKIPSHDQLREALSAAANERLLRSRLEFEKKAEAIFRFSAELLPTGLLVVDGEQKIRLANRALEKMMGYDQDELIGCDLSVLLSGDQSNHHRVLVSQYLDNPTQGHAMAAGRVVRGRTKVGAEMALEVSLSVHEFEGEKHAFASVVDVGNFTANQSFQRESTNRIQRAIEATNDGIWEWNLETNSVWYSHRLMKMIGASEHDEPKLELWRHHVHPEDVPTVEKALQDHFNKRKKFDIEYRGMSEYGEYEWMHTRGDTIFDNNNKPLLMSGTLTNINDKKKLEKLLKEKTRFLNEVLTRSLTGLYIFDLNTRCNTFINPEYTRITGYTLDDLQKVQHEDSLIPLFHPEDQARIFKHLDDVIAGKNNEGTSIEYRFRHKDGHWMWFYSRDSVYEVDADGKPTSMLGAFFEITELKQREADVRKLALDFLTTFEQAAVGIAHLDITGRFIKANARLCEILGYSWEQIRLKNFTEITYEQDVTKSVDLKNALLTGEIDNCALEKRYVKSDGSLIWALVTISVVREDDGNNSHFIAVVEDISKRKNMEMALEESNRALERFAYSASHDLQEPLRKISAFAGILQSRLEGKLDDPESLFQLNRISDAAKRMGEMIHSLLQLSRYSRQVLDKENCKLSTILNFAKEDLSNIINDKRAIIELISDGEIWCESAAIQQVMRNLISNALNYAKEDVPARIAIDLQSSPTKATITVQDNGPGFDNSVAEHIFEPFRRLHGMEVPGTGMGLAICRQIIKAHGGKIFATTNETGALFTIVLPVRAKDVTST